MANIKLTANEKAFVASMDNAAGSVGRLSAKLNIELARALRETDNITRNFAQGFGKLGEKFSSVGQTLTSAFTVPLGLAAGVASKFYGDIDQLKRALDVYGVSLNEIKKTAKLPGLGIEEAGKATINFLSVKYAADLSNKAVREFGNALIYSGRGKEELTGIATAFAQMKGKGNVMAQEINQIAERLPMIRDLMQQAFGTSDTEMIQKMGVTADEFLGKIVARLEQLPRVSGGFKTAWENVIDSVKLGSYEVVNVADKLFNLTGILDSISVYIDDAVNSFKSMPVEFQKTIFAVGGFIAVAGPLLAAIGGIIALSGPVIAAIGGISLPIIAVSALVVSFTATVVRNWGEISAVLKDTGIWSVLLATVKFTVGTIGEIFALFFDALTGDWTSFGNRLLNIVKRIWNSIVDVTFGVVNELLNILQGFAKLDSAKGWIENIKMSMGSFQSKIKAEVPQATDYLKKLGDTINGLGNVKVPTVTGGGEKDDKDKKKDKFAYMDAEWMAILNRKVANYLGDLKELSYTEYFKNELSELQKLIGKPTDFQITWADKILESGKKLKDSMPKIMSVIGVNIEKDFRKEVLDRMKKSFSDLGNLDTSSILVLPALVAKQLNFSAAGVKIDNEIKKNITDKGKLMSIEVQDLISKMSSSIAQNDLPNILAGLFESFGSGEGITKGLGNAFKSILSTIGQYMIELGKKTLMATALIEGLKKAFGTVSGPAASIALIVGGGLLKGLASSLFSQTPKFANGGIVSGPTLGLMGEYAGARSNPEVIAPLSKLKDLLGGTGGSIGVGEIKLKGEDLYISLQRYKNRVGDN